jgi:hypothetical protein
MNTHKKVVFVSIALELLILVSTPAFADKYGFDEQRLEEESDKCRIDPQCMEAVRRYEAQQVAQQRQRELQDQALKENNPLAYYTNIFGRLLIAVFVVAGIIGAYTFLFSLGGNKK